MTRTSFLRTTDDALARLVHTPWMFCTMVLSLTVFGLALDRYVQLRGQLLLSAVVWGVLVLSLRYLDPRERMTALVVVAVATCAEIIGSVIWGVYIYRLDNLPLFVPAGHGLVYLCGLRLSQIACIARRARRLVVAAILTVGIWAIAGLTIVDQHDAGGAFGALVLIVFLVRGRAPATYAGVFFVVAFLELYGTAIGTWTWMETVPGTPVTNGNPPSGVASGYVFFDIVALALAPRLLNGLRRTRAWIASYRPNTARRIAPEGDGGS